MKNRILFILLLPLFSSYSQTTLNEQAEQYYYSNPIVKGMNPDPSICRVGEDYYLITSSFGFYPGIPIYHSRDLVNWELIGHGIHSPDQLKLRNSKEDALNIYAATIRYYKGIFYIITTNVGRNHADRNFIITAKNPKGPWSKAHYIKNAPRIDPSLFFDDNGKVYYTGNDISENPVFEKQRNIWMQEIDLETFQLVGKKVVVIDPGKYYKEFVLAEKKSKYLTFYEGPHIYKKEGKYYLLVSHGGTFWDHAVSIWKSDKIFGPYKMYEKNPIATNRDFSKEAYIHHTGHADLVQTQNNEWWMVMLGVRPYGGNYTNLGRETCLVPVDWSGTWPIVNPLGPVGRVMPVHRKPSLPKQPLLEKNNRDNFKSKELGLQWNFMQTPIKSWWSLNESLGYLKIKLRPEIIEAKVNPSFIGKRQAHKNFTAITKMEFEPKSENEIAGMVLTRDVDNQFQLVCTLKDGKKQLQLIRKVFNEQKTVVIKEATVSGKSIYLKMEVLEQLITFSFSEDGENWTELVKDQDATIFSLAQKTGRFTGTFVGMYTSSNGKESSNFVLFDWFEYAGF